MGTLTLLQLRDELRFDLKNRPDTSASGLSDTRLDLFINSGYLHITDPDVFEHTNMRHRFTIALVTAVNTYTWNPTPVGAVTMRSLRWGTYLDGTAETPTVRRQKLIPRDVQWFENRQLASGGPTRHFADQGNGILAISPVPTATENGNLLLFEGWQEPVLLAADGDVTTLANAWDEILLLAARWRAELHLGYRELAEATKLDFVSLINEYRSIDDRHGADDQSWSPGQRSESYQEIA